MRMCSAASVLEAGCGPRVYAAVRPSCEGRTASSITNFEERGVPCDVKTGRASKRAVTRGLKEYKEVPGVSYLRDGITSAVRCTFSSCETKVSILYVLSVWS